MSIPAFTVVIPARLASSRLPNKPLADIGGHPMIVRVAERAHASSAQRTVVATDAPEVAAACAAHGVQATLTRADHASGTDRLAECAAIAGWDDDTVVVNLQGDEPFAPASGITEVARALVDSGAPMATLAEPVAEVETLFDPNTVKLVRAASGDALYFSRAPLPWPRDAFARDRSVLPAGGHWLRHIGIYAYRAGFLQVFARMPPGRLEQVESLEQLRVLEAGHRIAVALAPAPFPPGVDTPEDLDRAEARLRAAAA